jgi:hypothetical protein
LDRRRNFSAIALRIMKSPPNRRAKSTAMPGEPSTPQICDRPISSTKAGERRIFEVVAQFEF